MVPPSLTRWCSSLIMPQQSQAADCVAGAREPRWSDFQGVCGAMAESVGFPFMDAQLKELERRTMMYKYMVASAPVLHELLFQFTRNLSVLTISYHPCNLNSLSLHTY
ncbi:Growth-regulating factor, partial [Parasponia andersonii]